MAKMKKGRYPHGRASGYYDDRGYHPGPPSHNVLRELYPDMFPPKKVDIHSHLENWLIKEGYKIPRTSNVAWNRIRIQKEGEEHEMLYKGELSRETMLYFYDPEPQYGGYFSLDTIENLLKEGWKIVGKKGLIPW